MGIASSWGQTQKPISKHCQSCGCIKRDWMIECHRQGKPHLPLGLQKTSIYLQFTSLKLTVAGPLAVILLSNRRWASSPPRVSLSSFRSLISCLSVRGSTTDLVASGDPRSLSQWEENGVPSHREKVHYFYLPDMKPAWLYIRCHWHYS